MAATLKSEKRPHLSSGRLRRARRFCLEDSPPRDAALAVVGGGHEYCSLDYSVHPESSPYYSIEFVARGRGWLTLDGRSHRLDAGTIFSYGPGNSQRVTPDAPGALEKYFVNFTDRRAVDILKICGLAPGTVTRVSSVCEIQDIFDNLVRDGSLKRGESAMLCAALLEYLVIKVSSLLIQRGASSSTASAKFERCRQYVATHFRQLRTLTQIAEECEIDQAYLCRLFRRFGRQAPYQYLLRLKMNFAAEQLRDRNMLVKEVAASVGFTDPFHFSHAFKNVLGASPEIFRRQEHS